MSKGLKALTIAMAVIFVILLLFAIKMDMHPQDFIDHILPTEPTEVQTEDTTEPTDDVTIPDDTVPEETTRANQQGSSQNPGTDRPQPTDPTVPEETVETEPTIPPISEPAPSFEEDNWETPEF